MRTASAPSTPLPTSRRRHLELASQRAGDRMMAAFGRLCLLIAKDGFSQDQPRVPAGHPDAGQWTSGGSPSGAGSDGNPLQSLVAATGRGLRAICEAQFDRDIFQCRMVAFDRAMNRPTSVTHPAWLASKFRPATIEPPKMKILERVLHYSAKERAFEIPISIDLPVQGERDWSCVYRIGWPDGTHNGSGYGLDGMQALMLALQAIGADIYTSAYHRSGRLSWLDPGDGYGFPVPKTISHLLIGTDAAAIEAPR